MRRSFSTALALTALAEVSVCETASAAMNNLNPSTPVLTTTIKTKPKLPAGAATSTSSPTEKTNATSTSTFAVAPPTATAAAPATQSTAPNSSAAPTGAKPPNQSGLPPAVQLRQDITKQKQDIKKSENYLAKLQQDKLNPYPLLARYVIGPHSPAFRFQLPGGPIVEFVFRFNGNTGRLLPGEFDRFKKTVGPIIDKIIVAETQRIAAAKKRLAADYSALGGQD